MSPRGGGKPVALRSSQSASGLASYVSRQMNALFPDGRVTARQCAPFVAKALERLEYGFARLRLKSFFDGRSAVFNHLHTDQYAMFLYWLSNTIHRRGGSPALAAKAYALNKALHGIDVFYEVELPEIFAFQHPVGTVLGRARFSNYLFVYQRCTVGGNLDGAYPTLGEGVVMYGGSAVLGASTVGDNCWLGAGAQVKDADVPSDSVVFGGPPRLVIRPTERRVIRDVFRMPEPVLA